MGDDSSAGFAGLFGFAIGVGLGLFCATLFCNVAWSRDAIKAGVGEYDSVTGAFQWVVKEEVK